MAKRAHTPRRRELVTLGKRLRSWRQAKGWTQEKLAWAAGLDYSHYNEIENGKLNPGALTLFAIAQTLELSPAVFFLPVAEARKLVASSVHPLEVLEQRLGSQLAEPELLELHCDFVELSLKRGQFELAGQWLKTLTALHPQHWRVHYSWARYFVLKNQPVAGQSFQIALSIDHYQAQTPEWHELQQAFKALQTACAQPGTDNLSREKALTDADFRILRELFPEQWQALFQQP